jgi:hypothetical protein
MDMKTTFPHPFFLIMGSKAGVALIKMSVSLTNSLAEFTALRFKPVSFFILAEWLEKNKLYFL